MKIMKRLSAILLAVTMIILTSCQSKNTVSDDNAILPDQENTQPVVDMSQDITTTSSEAEENTTETPADPYKTALAYCVNTDSFSQQTNINQRIYPASMTKFLTAYTALKYISPDANFTVGSEQEMVQPESSLCLIQAGNVLTLYDLLTGLLLVSGNDAAYTIAVGTARRLRRNDELSDSQAVEYFCKLMNQAAKEIGMVDSHFETPDGWDNENQYTTTADLLMLTKHAIKNQSIREIISTKEANVTFVEGGNITWENRIQLIDPESSYYCDEFIGGKTGTTESAGYCLISVFEKNGKTYIIIVTGCIDDDARCAATLDLYEQIK